MARTAHPIARAPHLLTALVVGTLLLTAVPAPVAAAEWKERATRYAVIYHSPELGNTAEQLATIIDPVIEGLAALHDSAPRRPFAVRLHASTDTYARTSPLAAITYGEIAQAGFEPPELALAEPRLRNQTPEQLRNLFRRGISQLMLHEQTQGRLPIGLREGAAQYAEQAPAEVEVGARVVDRAGREGQLLRWNDLNTPERFAASGEVGPAQSYAVVAYLLDRYGLAAWGRLLATLRSGASLDGAMTTAYGKAAEGLEAEWQGYLPEYLGGSFRINHFSRYDLTGARAHLQNGRFVEAGDELTASARFIAGAGRVAKEAELREVAKEVEGGLEGNARVQEGRAQMAAFNYAAARDAFNLARQRFEALGASGRVEEVGQAIAAAEAGVQAVAELAEAERLLSEVRYGEAQTAALSAGRTFAALGDEEHYRRSWAILQELSTTQTRLAYILATLGILFAAFSVWRLLGRSGRQPIPGVLR